jgi:hypothetical protein
MSITLTDVPAAVADYIKQNVTMELSAVVHSTSSVLQPDEEATFTVTLTNATEGVRLINIVWDVSIHPVSAAYLHPFGSILRPCRSEFDLSKPVLKETDTPSRLVVWPIEPTGLATLDPGQVIKFDDFAIHTMELGDATVNCHVYATVDQASLFPVEQPSKTVKQAFTVQ